MKTNSGIQFTNCYNVLIAAAHSTPRLTKYVKLHDKTLATKIEGKFCPDLKNREEITQRTH